MRTLTDHEGRAIRLTDERRQHILDHPEMADLDASLDETVRDPEKVIQSAADTSAHLFYRFRKETSVGAKWLRVVAKCLPDDAFVLTAYLTTNRRRESNYGPKSEDLV